MPDQEALLRDEYMLLQKTIEDFDGKSLQIKTWSVGLTGLSGLAAAFGGQAAPLAIGALAAASFWVVDAIWKANQHAYLGRLAVIEAHFRGGDAAPATTIAPFQVYASWSSDSAEGSTSFLKYMFWGNVFLPHAVLLFVFLVGFLITPL
jgi:hypothetical protein